MTATASEDQAARSAFAEWAAQQVRAPRDPAALIQEVELRYEHLGALATDILGRRVVWKSVPAGSTARITFPGIAFESVDAWSVDAQTLRARSDHVAICEGCGGQKKVRCTDCGGTGSLLCTACGGQRKMYGYAANGSYRLLNCTACRGKGAVDCSNCRRGIASCGTCDGEGRLQRWIELEWWRRSVATLHPDALARQFHWDENISNEAIARDAMVVCDVEKPHRLAPADIGNVAPQWLDRMNPALHAGERVARQRLRIASVPVSTIRYRLGRAEDQAVFTGRRLFAPVPDPLSAFSRRASNLRSLAWLLLCAGIVILLFSLGRGAFYASIATFFSLVAATGMLFMTYYAVADWTALRRHTHRWLFAAAAFLFLAIASAFAALPRPAHAEQLLAAGDLDAADRELTALGDVAPATAWADLRLARIRGTTDEDAARELFAKIPRELPQSRAAAPLVYLPLARRQIGNSNWSAAAKTIAEARGAGVDPATLDSLAGSIRKAADDAIAEAKRQRDAAQRLRLRLSAEAALVGWERATDNWGTPSLIELRTAMARDVAAVEKPARRRR